jgi:hypothetical protein
MISGPVSPADFLNRLLQTALSGVADSLIVSLSILIGCLVASFVFALCAFACYKIPFASFLPGIRTQRFRQVAKVASAAGLFALSIISFAFFLDILFGSVDFQ